MSMMGADPRPPEPAKPGSMQPDCSALRRYLEIVQYENRGGNYRKHPVEGERERAAKDGLRAMWQLEYALERIAKAQSAE